MATQLPAQSWSRKTALGVTKSDEQSAPGVNKGERFQVPPPGCLNGAACKPRVTNHLSRVATAWELVSEMHNKQAQKRIPVSMPRLFSLY
jgi:hypothetical protein